MAYQPVEPLESWREYMRDGEFERAWEISDRVRPAVWDGSDLRGKSVLVRCDRGLGDAIQFLRYVPMLRQSCPSVTVQAPPDLLSTVRTIRGVDRVIPYGDADGCCEAAIESTELPYAFRTQLATIPAQVPYIEASPRLGCRNGVMRVGVVWAAGPWDPRRSIPLAAFAPLGRIPGISWTALQHGPALRQARAYGAALGIEAIKKPENDEVLETARTIAGLDLVITVDTMVAHLAGALARPVWTLLPVHADWRWLRERDDSPWYPTMRLFRQRRPGDWKDVIDRVGEALSAQVDVIRGGEWQMPCR